MGLKSVRIAIFTNPLSPARDHWTYTRVSFTNMNILKQDYYCSELPNSDIVTMIKARRLAWIPRLFKKMANQIGNALQIWDRFLKSFGGLRFILTCNPVSREILWKYSPILQGHPPVLSWTEDSMDAVWEIPSYVIIRKFASMVKLLSGRNGL